MVSRYGGVSLAADKKRLTYAKCLNDFKEELDVAVSAIPPEKAIEADYQIIGPALEDAKYCADKQSLRNMFTNLISRTLNSDTTSMVHPSFSGIIKQMNPLDAENLSILAKGPAPIAEYRAMRISSSYRVLQTNVFLENPRQQDIYIQSVSLSALAQLGLVELHYHTRVSDGTGNVSNKFYGKFSHTELYHHFCSTFISPTPKDGFQKPRDNLLVREVKAVPGRACISPLGASFAKICL